MDPIYLNKNKEIVESAVTALRDILAPAALEIAPSFLRLNKKLARAFFVFNYPRFLNTNWFSEVINLDKTLDISFFIHPIDTGIALKNLRKKVAQVESELDHARRKRPGARSDA